MALNEHKRAVSLALRTNDELGKLINRMGTKAAPRGRVLSAYRQARRAAAQVDGLGGLLDVLAELRATLAEVMREVLTEAAAVGVRQAMTELAVYGLPNQPAPVATTTEWAAWMAMVDAQFQAVQGTWIASDGDLALVVGDEERVGLLSPGPVVREGARWVALTALAGWTATTVQGISRGGRRPDDFLRQAVAAIDERTTDCCLRVHGQVVGMREDFVLTGTPRFAERLRNPPFHEYCRSSVCLVRQEDAGDTLTQQMVEAAEREVTLRETTGTRRVITPAHARSGR